MPALKTAIGNYGLTRPLKDGSVSTGGLQLEYIEVEPIIAAMRRMVRGLEFDVCVCAFTTYLSALSFNKPVTAIPVFVTRNFHQRAVFINTKSGIKTPRDLEGRTVGVNRGYTVTTGLWVRGILQHEYGVDLDKITWAATDDEHVAEFKLPSNANYSIRGKSIVDLLASGEIAAAVGDLRTDSPDIKPLIPNARDAGFAYYRKTGIYPLNHTIVVKNSVLQAQPRVAQELFNAFTAAKKAYLAHLETASKLEASDETAVALKQVVGDPFPYGVNANRKALETIVQFAVEQRVIPKTVSVEQLFAKGTLELEG
jgi:4,5-dihydroxyphthalate decarboxylase